MPQNPQKKMIMDFCNGYNNDHDHGEKFDNLFYINVELSETCHKSQNFSKIQHLATF